MTISHLVDTSVAVSLLVAAHSSHARVNEWARGKQLGIAGHALVETYSVLTRLQGGSLISAIDAVRLIDANFTVEFGAKPGDGQMLHREFASVGITGGATYDGLVALAAKQLGFPLASRDQRALQTYAALGIEVELISGA